MSTIDNGTNNNVKVKIKDGKEIKKIINKKIN